MLFKEKMKKYDKYSLLVTIWNIGIQVMAYLVKHDNTFLGCHDNEKEWIYTGILGSLFTLFHMMSIMMQTMMILHVYWCVPIPFYKGL